MTQKADLVICGAGISGVAAAYFLSKAGIKNILLFDENPPLSFTSDRSTECYRNWWPDAEMLTLMNSSIDLMEMVADESGNICRMNRRGYLYVTADEDKIADLETDARGTAGLGAGPLRVHSSASLYYRPSPPEGFRGQPTGADLLIGYDLIQKYFPYLTERTVAALHIRRAGWLSAQQLGMYLLETARRRGVQFESARVTGVDVANGCVKGISLSSGERVDSPIFINAAGPYLKRVGQLLGVDLPVYTELHLKAAIKDNRGVVGRDAPLLIWNDVQTLPWEDDERQALSEDGETRWLAGPLPAGVHTRPEGSGENQTILMLWEYQSKAMEPVWPPKMDEQYAEIAMRGLAAMLPRMKEYFGRMPRPQVDGGYYTKTRENRPLVGPMGVEGAYVVGAVSGYGIMSACGVGDLLATHVTGAALPSYAPAFELARYDNAEYRKKLENWGESGQL
jgi:glycine/D-amino acid oxidase-like deaminating enzyme